MAKKKVKVEKHKPVDEVVFRCNLCGKVNKTKECCGDDFTQQTRPVRE